MNQAVRVLVLGAVKILVRIVVQDLAMDGVLVHVDQVVRAVVVLAVEVNRGGMNHGRVRVTR